MTTVVELPEPRVYVRTTDSDPPAVAGTPPLPDAPVPRGTVGAGVTLAPSEADALAAYDEAMAELADSAAVTGQTVVVIAIVSVTTTPAEEEFRAGQLVTVGAQLVMV